MEKIIKELKCRDLDEVYLNLGNNKYTPKSIVEIVYPEVKTKVLKKEVLSNNNTDIKVSGIDNIKVNIASCCNPLPGDKIVGFITKSNGISIHRLECSNILNKEQVIDVKWQTNTKNKYLTKIRIYTNSNISNLGDIINKLTSSGLVINNIVTNIVDLKYSYQITFHIASSKELDNIFKNLLKLDYIVDIERVIK